MTRAWSSLNAAGEVEYSVSTPTSVSAASSGVLKQLLKTGSVTRASPTIWDWSGTFMPRS